jgi:hypothetical protein
VAVVRSRCHDSQVDRQEQNLSVTETLRCRNTMLQSTEVGRMNLESVDCRIRTDLVFRCYPVTDTQFGHLMTSCSLSCMWVLGLGSGFKVKLNISGHCHLTWQSVLCLDRFAGLKQLALSSQPSWQLRHRSKYFLFIPSETSTADHADRLRKGNILPGHFKYSLEYTHSIASFLDVSPCSFVSSDALRSVSLAAMHIRVAPARSLPPPELGTTIHRG